MKTKCVEWLGEERMLPGIGLGQRGAVVCGPEDVMESYVSQGLAKDHKPVKAKSVQLDEGETK